jgi:transcriptional regulator with XRE-family HTH domain
MSELNRRYFDALLAERKLSLRALAAKMGMNHSQLSLTFSGGRRMTLDEAAQLSNIFGVPLHKIVENAGVTVKPTNGRRVPVIGVVRGDGTVELYDGSTIERTTVPEEMPADSVAVQCRMSGTQLDWMDGFVMFCRKTDDVDPASLGRVCLCKIKEGAVVVGLVRRGYRENTANLAGPFHQDSVVLEWASPIAWTRN